MPANPTYHTVITFYLKTGGKNGKHTSISKSSNISTVSNVAVQLFEFMHGRQFCHMPEETSCLQTWQFALLPSLAFLTLLSSSLKIHAGSGTLELTQEDSNWFNALDKGSAKFRNAMVLSRK